MVIFPLYVLTGTPLGTSGFHDVLAERTKVLVGAQGRPCARLLRPSPRHPHRVSGSPRNRTPQLVDSFNPPVCMAQTSNPIQLCHLRRDGSGTTPNQPLEQAW